MPKVTVYLTPCPVCPELSLFLSIITGFTCKASGGFNSVLLEKLFKGTFIHSKQTNKNKTSPQNNN